jgi:choline-sulfatase
MRSEMQEPSGGTRPASLHDVEVIMGKGRRRREERQQQRTSGSAPRSYAWVKQAAVALVVIAVVGAGIWWFTRPRLQQGLPSQLRDGAAAGYNVVVLTLDTTRADHIGCYGYAPAATPRLDGLAARGLRFADAVSTAPITLPAHASIFTGLNPPGHGARHNAEFNLAADQTTLAEVLNGQGYDTAAFVSAFVLDSRFGLDQGFDHYDDDISVASRSVVDREGNERLAGNVTAAAIDWLQGRDADKPFFMWVHYYDPHNPYLPPAPFSFDFRSQPYDGEIAYMDQEIGRLLDAIDEAGARKRTLVIVVGDHGESLGEHGEATHTMFVYEAAMHVPLIVSCPGLFSSPHVVDDRVVSVADVFPTVLDLLGIERAGDLDGLPLHVDGPDAADRLVYMETLAPYFDNGWSPLFAMRSHDNKYIRAPRQEFYDLQADPRELQNLFGKADGAGAAVRDTLVAALARHLQDEPTLAEVASMAEALDPTTQRRLRSLGYVAGGNTARDKGDLADPKDMMAVIATIDRANAYVHSGNLPRALETIKRAQAASPNDRTVLRTLGKIQLFLGNDAEAEQALRAANDVAPHPDACLLLAQMYVKNDRLDEAAPLIAQTLELDPRHGGGHIARGDLLVKQGKVDEGIAAYGDALRLDPHRTGDIARARIAAARRGETPGQR